MTEIFRPPFFQPDSINGIPLAAAKLYFYNAGTTTAVTVYQDAALTTPHASPVVADASGIFAPIYFNLATYKIVLKTFLGITVYTADNIPGIGASVSTVASRTALKAIDTTTITWVLFDGSIWKFTSGDFSSRVTADPLGGLVVKADAISASVGAWVRQYSGPPDINWWPGVDKTGATDSAVGIRAALLAVTNGGQLYAPVGQYLLDSVVNGAVFDLTAGALLNKAVSLKGDGWNIKVGGLYSAPTGTVFRMGSSLADTDDIFHFAGTDKVDGIRITDAAFVPYNGALGTAKGRHGIFVDGSAAALFYLTNFVLQNVYWDNMKTGDSFKSTGSTGAGAIAYSQIKDCSLMTINLALHGDSIEVIHNTLGYNNTSGRPELIHSNISGAAGFASRDNNIAAINGVIDDGGLDSVYDHDELEMPSGLQNSLGSMLYLRGGTSQVIGAVVDKGSISQNSTLGKIKTLRIGNAFGAKVIDMSILRANAFAFIDSFSLGLAISIASPGVVTWPNHGLDLNDTVTLSTTGALPTGLAAGTYFVKTILGVNTFTLSATAGGAVINTSGTQSGIHTAVISQARQITVDSTSTSMRHINNTNLTGGSTETAYIADAGTDTAEIGAVVSSFTPGWFGSSVNPAIGNGTSVGRKVTNGRSAQYRGKITAGPSTTFGTGDWLFTLGGDTLTDQLDIGVADYFDASTGNHYIGQVFSNGAQLVSIRTTGTAVVWGSANAPVAPAQSDTITFYLPGLF